MYNNPYGDFSGQGAEALGVFSACYAFFFIALVAFMIFLFYRILVKAGYSGWLALLNLIPFGFGTLGLMIMLAFGNWPALSGGQRMMSPMAPPSYPQQPMPPMPQPQPPVPPVAPAEPMMPQPPAPPVEQPPAPPSEQPPAPPVG